MRTPASSHRAGHFHRRSLSSPFLFLCPNTGRVYFHSPEWETVLGHLQSQHGETQCCWGSPDPCAAPLGQPALTWGWGSTPGKPSRELCLLCQPACPARPLVSGARLAFILSTQLGRLGAKASFQACCFCFFLFKNWNVKKKVLILCWYKLPHQILFYFNTAFVFSY